MSGAVGDAVARELAGLLATRTGQRLDAGRRWRIEAALRPLVADASDEAIEAFARRAVSGDEPALADRVVDALLNHETSFFRDVRAFGHLIDAGFGRLRDARADTRRLAVWSAGCSTGQEAYSLAMAIADRPDLWDGWRVDILATDVSGRAVAAAREGRYTQFEIQRGLPIGQMLRRFRAEGDGWRADADLRRAVRFQVHNLVDPPPPGRFDCVLCRNVLLYFPGDVRRLVFDRIATAMAPDGVLMLGAGEAAMGQTDRFASDDAARGLFRPLAAPSGAA